MKYLPLLSVMIFLSTCVPVSTPSTSVQKKVIFDNADYEENVGIVQVFPASQSPQASLENPVIALNDPGFMISFDLFEENYSYVNVRLIHCNADWTRSNLADLQFLSVYNEFPINSYEYSANTRKDYVNYKGLVQTPLKSGNYLVVAYRENNINDLIFSRRVMVFEQLSKIDVQVRQSTIVAKRDQNHQVDFSVKYDDLEDPTPMNQFKVKVLQNHNWNTVISGLEPTLMRTDQNYLEYRHFNGENNFPALNEFRFFDLRAIDFRGRNVSAIQKDESIVRANLVVDKPRSGLAYTQINNDLNGNFWLQNLDPNDSPMQSEYVDVKFELIADEIEGDVFVTGRFNNWRLNPMNLLYYDYTSKSYKGNISLRQGYYDYMYWVRSESGLFYQLEGAYFQAENEYEILFYYRNTFNNYDQLIGYRKISSRN